MYSFAPVEEHLDEQLAPRAADPETKQTGLWSCMYVTVFTFLYGLSFAMPFWTADIPTTGGGSDHTDGPPVRPVDHPAVDFPSSQGNGSQIKLRSFSEVWRYSWEHTGLAVRCLTLLLLLTGWLISLCRLCSDRGPLPASLPIFCGIVGGVTGVYAELVLWLGVYLLAANSALTESLVFCSATSLFSFFVGIAVYRTRISALNSAASPPRRDAVLGPLMHDWSRPPRACTHHFPPSEGGGFPDSPHQGRRSLAAMNEVPAYFGAAAAGAAGAAAGGAGAAPQNPYDSNDTLSDHSEEDELCKARIEGQFASYVCADVCPPEDLPEALRRPTQVVSLRDRDDTLSDSSPLRGSEEEEGKGEEEEGKGEEDRPTKELPADDVLRSSLPEERDVTNEGGGGPGKRARNADDFDHPDQFIDDDFFYHSSDDQLLERFIEVGSRGSSSLRGQHGSRGCSEDSGKTSADSSTRLLLIHQDDRGQSLLPFPDSEEYHSFSDDEVSYKNKTWP